MYYKEHCFNPPLEILTEFQPPENPLQKKKGGTFATPGNALRSRGASGGKTASNRCWIHWASSIHWDKARWWSVMIPDSPALKSHLSNHPCSRIYFFRVRVSWIFLRRCNKKITKRRICKKTSEIWNHVREFQQSCSSCHWDQAIPMWDIVRFSPQRWVEEGQSLCSCASIHAPGDFRLMCNIQGKMQHDLVHGAHQFSPQLGLIRNECQGLRVIHLKYKKKKGRQGWSSNKAFVNLVSLFFLPSPKKKLRDSKTSKFSDHELQLLCFYAYLMWD